MIRSPCRAAATLAVAVLSLALLPRTAAPQAATVVDVQRADEALAQATSLHDERADWAEAARLYAESARLRPPEDPNALHSAVMAGRIQIHLGLMSEGVRTLEHAGDRALTVGDVFGAARAYLDVAFCAQREGQFDMSREFGKKAALLAKSPLLTPGQRFWIERRLSQDAPDFVGE